MNSSPIRFLHTFFELVILNIAFICALLLRFGANNIPYETEYFQYQVYVNLTWIVLNINQSRPYARIIFDHLYPLMLFFKKIVLHIFLSSILIVLLNIFIFSRLHLLYFYIIFVGGVFLMKLVSDQIVLRLLKEGKLARRIVIIGRNDLSFEIIEYIRKNKYSGYQILKAFTSETDYQSGNLESIINFCNENIINEIFCCQSEFDQITFEKLNLFCDNNHINLSIIPDKDIWLVKNTRLDYIDEIPVLTLLNSPLDDFWNRFAKRSFDLTFSLLVVVLILSWLIPIVAILIKFGSKGPVFFAQRRHGKKNKVFYCLKFRTMTVLEDGDFKQATQNDSRITKLGLFLRKTSLDEMPQFINVLLGDMSIVGPRPHALAMNDEYRVLIDNYMHRHYVKQGITGLAQVRGHRGETKSLQAMHHRVRLDLFYIKNWTFGLDLRIVLMTISQAIMGDKNAY